MNHNSITSIIHPKFVFEICNFECSKKVTTTDIYQLVRIKS